ncbi:hypothetical protein A0H81_14425 [Grifola frondosa]|uniref:DUF6593 domain-containing protein n=1 Tax=Grifola frondosa TaxID=5627 RepID=A0A1C7LM61_GRIFR|nr:hypothetical protein A0H81_14425 [Grifola frondosa]
MVPPADPPSYDDVVESSASSARLESHQDASSRLSMVNDLVSSDSSSRHEESAVYLLPPMMGPVVYSFVQQSFNSMILSGQHETSPYYHISVHTNCFIPSSYITVIRRGSNEDGDLIGSFEMGISEKKPTVKMGDRERVLDIVLFRAGSKSDRAWHWRWHSDIRQHLCWRYDSPVKYCYLRTQSGNPSGPILAAYTPPPLVPRADGFASPPASLKLYPEGQELFDHILVSALVIERKRLTPSAATLKQLFN